MKVNGKTIIVTGAGNGIGRELTLNLLARGAHVAAVDISGSALDETKRLAGSQAGVLSLHVVDITVRSVVEALPEQVLAQHGNVDGLINNAGIIQPFVRVRDLDFDHILRVMNVNFYGTLYLIKTFLPYMLQRPEAHLVNVSSMGGFLPVPGQSVYGASKAAVKLLTEALYAEMRDTGVRVTVVFPGAIGTDIVANSGVAAVGASGADMEKSKARTLKPSRAAQIIVDGMEKDKVRVFVGRDARMMDILYRLNPVYATNLIAKQMRGLLPA